MSRILAALASLALLLTLWMSRLMLEPGTQVVPAVLGAAFAVVTVRLILAAASAQEREREQAVVAASARKGEGR